MRNRLVSLGLIVMLAILAACTEPTETDIEDLISRMTLAEKIGQMTQAERKHATPEDLKTYFLGSILNGGGSVPGDNTVEEWRDMVDAYQTAALQTRLAIPMIYGVDAVHGHNNVKGATIFPHNVGLGAMRNPDLMEAIGVATAEEVVATGVHWDFAPALCVAQDDRWGRAYECYGEDPEIGVAYSGRIVKGYQASGKMIATAKHWVGDGGTAYGTGDHEYVIDRGTTNVSEEVLRNTHIAPYLPAIEAGVGSVMISYSSVNNLKMHEHKRLNTDVLKNELGFKGFTVTDWQAMEEVRGETNRERVVASINSGVDMAMEPEHWKEFIIDLSAAVEAGEVSMARIDDAVRRILTTKKQLGLFTAPMSADRAPNYAGILGGDKNRAVARRAVSESLVLLKNEGVLPLKKGAKVFVAGEHANNIGLQSGGWTIDWQGKSGNITPGTSILAGIDEVGGVEATFSANGEGAAGHDVAIVVVGEQPYAEGKGDYNVQPCEFCQPLTLTQEQIKTIENVKASGVPLLVILISGRPLLLEPQLNLADAFVAAWLPGTEGAGIADVLFGVKSPTGRLSVTWPKTMDQVTLNTGDENYTPLFPYGFGLSY
ncbi:MAG: glycoside hydrolase family 3 N-terminal domain-containing protein [Pseudomonadales bacterium]